MSQRTRKYFVVGSFAALAASLVSVPAYAQAWLKDRRYSEGAGVKLGDFELHPGIGAEFGYDSNWFLRSSKSRDEAINGGAIGAAMLRVTPSVSLSTIGEKRREGAEGQIADPPTVAFRLNLSATYREFFGPENISDQRNVALNADTRIDIFPKRPFTFAILGGYIRTIRPNVTADPSVGFNTSNPYVGAEAKFTPNNGTFDASLGYTLNAILFEQSVGAPFTNLRHEVTLRDRWRFRPRTALFHDTTVGVIAYTQSDRAVNVLTDSVPVRTKVGINGLVTSRFATLLSVGYGGSFYEARPSTNQFDSLLAQVEGRFYLTDNPETSDPGKLSLTQSSIAVGYLRDFENSYLGDLYGTDKGYLNLSYFFGGRVLVSLGGGVTALRYPRIFIQPGGTPVQISDPFTVIRPEAQLFGEYRFTDAFGVNATLTYMQNVTDKRLNYTGNNAAPPSQVFDLGWSRFTAFLGVRYFL